MVVCRHGVLREGLAPLCWPRIGPAWYASRGGDGHRSPYAARSRERAAVAVLCDRGMADPAQYLPRAARVERPRRVVVVLGRADVDLMLEMPGGRGIGGRGRGRRAPRPARGGQAALRGEDYVAPSSLLAAAGLAPPRSAAPRPSARAAATSSCCACWPPGGRRRDRRPPRRVAEDGPQPLVAALRRLGVRSRAEAVRIAEERGLLD